MVATVAMVAMVAIELWTTKNSAAYDGNRYELWITMNSGSP